MVTTSKTPNHVVHNKPTTCDDGLSALSIHHTKTHKLSLKALYCKQTVKVSQSKRLLDADTTHTSGTSWTNKSTTFFCVYSPAQPQPQSSVTSSSFINASRIFATPPPIAAKTPSTAEANAWTKEYLCVGHDICVGHAPTEQRSLMGAFSRQNNPSTKNRKTSKCTTPLFVVEERCHQHGIRDPPRTGASKLDHPQFSTGSTENTKKQTRFDCARAKTPHDQIERIVSVLSVRPMVVHEYQSKHGILLTGICTNHMTSQQQTKSNTPTKY